MELRWDTRQPVDQGRFLRPNTTTCFGVGAAPSGSTNAHWYAEPSAAVGIRIPTGTGTLIYKSTNGGQSFFADNADMLGITCTSPTACIQVGDGGRIRSTTDGGVTWSDGPSPTNKPLVQIQCPSSSICYAAGDEGQILKSTDGGSTWNYIPD